VSEISRGLKNLARELKVPVLALSQLSRNVEQRGSAEPRLSDLRESGSLEQDADVVIFLYRAEGEPIADADLELVKAKIAKHRNGPIGEVPLQFRRTHTRFYGVAARDEVEVTAY
jgi:replicative DNA helicase